MMMKAFIQTDLSEAVLDFVGATVFLTQRCLIGYKLTGWRLFD
jgi:hypothetical protein